MSADSIDIAKQLVTLQVTLTHRSETSVQMVVDTGATYVLIPWEVALSIGVEVKDTRFREELITASGHAYAPLMTISKVEVLGKSVMNCPVIVHDLPENSYSAGLLGLSFLKHFDLRINFREGYLELQ